MKCENHWSREAEGICVKCGKPMCKECLVDVGGKNHCKRCLKKMTEIYETPQVIIHNSVANSNSHSNINHNNQDAENVGWGMAICCCIIIIALILLL